MIVLDKEYIPYSDLIEILHNGKTLRYDITDGYALLTLQKNGDYLITLNANGNIVNRYTGNVRNIMRLINGAFKDGWYVV